MSEHPEDGQETLQTPAACYLTGYYNHQNGFFCFNVQLSQKNLPTINPSPALHISQCSGELGEEDSQKGAPALPHHPKTSSPRSLLAFLPPPPPTPLLLSIQLR